MKGVNASKIAAIAASAMLLASGVVSAGLMYENIELVNPNGQPTAKVVVGSQAQISDGIAAANIAAVLANKAYKSSTLSATVVGTATCTATGTTAGGTGTCEVLSKKALIEIVVPGQMANAYQFKTLITDTIDRTLQNRVSKGTEDEYPNSLDDNDVNTVLSPLRGSGVSSGKQKLLFRISGDQFTPFKSQSIRDKQASAEFTYQVSESFWVGSTDGQVFYDSSAKEIVARPSVVAYSVFFGGNDYGIPVCTKANENGTGNWAWCDSSDQYATANHRLQIPFLGSKWIISSMSKPSTNLTSSTNAVRGGTIKLAKEANYDIINVGGIIDAGDFKVRLQDISVAVGYQNRHPAILDILDSSGSVIGQIKVDEGETYTFTHSASGKSLKIHVYKTAPGFTLAAKWAEMAIYSDEIILQDGQAYNLESSSGKNYKFKVSLIWKNRDYSSSGTNDPTPDSLRQIVIYNEDSFIGAKYKKGDTFNFLADPAVFKLTYNGLDLEAGDYIPIQIESLTSTSYPVSTDGNDCPTTSNRVEYNARLIRFTTSGANFGSGSGNDLLGSYKLESFYFDPIGCVNLSDGSVCTGNNSVRFSGTQDWARFFTNNRTNASPAILYRPSGYTCYLVANVTKNQEIAENIAPSNTSTVRFDYAGSDSGAYGLLFFSVNQNGFTSMPNITLSNYLNYTVIAFQEDAGKRNTTSHYPVTTVVPLFASSSENSFKFKSQASTTNYIYYSGINRKGDISGNINGTNGYESNEPIFYTERGSYIDSYSDTSYVINVAKKIGQPTFTFSFTDAVLTESGEVWEAKEGETKTLDNGVKLKVKEIQVSTGTCKVAGGAAPTCTPDMSPVSARIMPDNSPTVQAVVPYDVRGTNLVISDREASAVGGVQILVGGPAVNSATAAVLANSPVDFDVTNVYVKAIGNKIVVAGKTAADTMQAANEFISRLTVN